MMKIGFIGAGNMASSIMNGLINANVINVSDLSISDHDSEKLKFWKEKGAFVSNDNKLIASNSEIVFFAVKPNVLPSVLDEIDGNDKKLYISIAAGVTVRFLESKLGSAAKIVRTMPNTPAMVNCGMTVVSPNCNVTDNEKQLVLKLFNSIGLALILPEKDLEIATAIHSSSPAYIYMMIDAMADAGVRYGLTKSTALQLAAKAVEGSAKMVLETGIHPEQLKDNVCSPGGTTIAAVCELERTGFRASLQQAIDACVKRNTEMKK